MYKSDEKDTNVLEFKRTRKYFLETAIELKSLNPVNDFLLNQGSRYRLENKVMKYGSYIFFTFFIVKQSVRGPTVVFDDCLFLKIKIDNTNKLRDIAMNSLLAFLYANKDNPDKALKDILNDLNWRYQRFTSEITKIIEDLENGKKGD